MATVLFTYHKPVIQLYPSPIQVPYPVLDIGKGQSN